MATRLHQIETAYHLHWKYKHIILEDRVRVRGKRCELIDNIIESIEETRLYL